MAVISHQGTIGVRAESAAPMKKAAITAVFSSPFMK
jgi:hypothetical protein